MNRLLVGIYFMVGLTLPAAESPESVATVADLAPILPLMTKTNSELQCLLPQ